MTEVMRSENHCHGTGRGTRWNCLRELRGRALGTLADPVCLVSSLLRHVSVMASETLAPAGIQGGSGRSGRVSELVEEVCLVRVAMERTSTPHWRRRPRKNRRIPGMSSGCIDGGAAGVRCVGTEPRA